MPFDFSHFQHEIEGCDWDKLVAIKKKYTKMASGGVSGEVISTLLIPFTFGISAVGTVASAAQAMNAGIKVDMINAEMRSRGNYAHTRLRDISAGMALSLGSAVVGNGVGHLASHIATSAVFGVSHVASEQAGHALATATEQGLEHGVEKLFEKELEYTGHVCDNCYKVNISSQGYGTQLTVVDLLWFILQMQYLLRLRPLQLVFSYKTELPHLYAHVVLSIGLMWVSKRNDHANCLSPSLCFA
jgi:hypothetical protein